MLNVLLGESDENLKHILDFFYPKGGILLDISFGKGKLVESLENKWSVVGSDLSGYPANIKASWDKLPFKENIADVVLFDPPYLLDKTSYILHDRPDTRWKTRHTSTFNEIINYSTPAREANRCLKSGGIFIIKTQNCRDKKSQYVKNDISARAAIEESGFKFRELLIYLRLSVGIFRNKKTPQQAYGFFIVGEKF